MWALLGSAAFAASPLALPQGPRICFTQRRACRRQGKAALAQKAACAEVPSDSVF